MSELPEPKPDDDTAQKPPSIADTPERIARAVVTGRPQPRR